MSAFGQQQTVTTITKSVAYQSGADIDRVSIVVIIFTKADTQNQNISNPEIEAHMTLIGILSPEFRLR